MQLVNIMNCTTHRISELFKTVAYVDWIGVTITTMRTTNQQTVQLILHKALNLPEGRDVWVKPLDAVEGGGGAASVFYLRFQDPKNYGQVHRAVTMIEDAKGFSCPPKIIDIELGLDFFSKAGSPDRLPDLLLGLAGRHHARGGSPRLYMPGSEGVEAKTKALLSHGMRIRRDGTYYVGHKADPIYWKAYVKRLDRVRRDDGKITAIPLPTKDHRARIEVTLQQEATEYFGLSALTDLEHFEFGKLAKLFKFRKARDVSQMAKGVAAVQMASNWLRQYKDATEERGQCSFEHIGQRDRWHRQRKHSRHTIADDELNKTARERLKRLSERFAKKGDEI